MRQTECCYDECEECEFQDCNNDTMICLISRLALAFHKLVMDMPVLKHLADDYKYCHWFIKRM